MLNNPLPITELLHRYDISPSKGLGQYFLIDQNALRKIIELSEIKKEDEVLEIGPGLGSLTRHLSLKAKRVVAVELDGRMIPALNEVLISCNNVEIINADIMEVDVASIFAQPGYLVVANIPYYITSAVLRHVLKAAKAPSRLVLTVQKEVGFRICSEAGKMSVLSISVQLFGKPSVVGQIPAGAFYPSPKVDSVIVKVDLFPTPQISSDDMDQFFLLVRAGFSQKRKTINNALSAGMRWDKDKTGIILRQAGIDTNRRAQTLEICEWKSVLEVAKHIS